MKKTGIFYGSTNGDTESVANKIAIQLGIGKGDVHNVADTCLLYTSPSPRGS